MVSVVAWNDSIEDQLLLALSTDVSEELWNQVWLDRFQGRGVAGEVQRVADVDRPVALVV